MLLPLGGSGISRLRLKTVLVIFLGPESSVVISVCWFVGVLVLGVLVGGGGDDAWIILCCILKKVLRRIRSTQQKK